MGYGMNNGVSSPKPGMSPRKEMAGGTSSGSFGVSAYPGKNGTPHPDAAAKTGMKMHMADSERAVGMPVGGGQAAPDHGKMFPGMDFNRGGKI